MKRPRATQKGGAVIVILIILFGMLVVGGVLTATVYTIKRSPAYQAAEKFVRNNSEVQSVVGTGMDFGMIPKGSVRTSASEGSAEFRLKVRGSTGRTQVTVLEASKGGEWRVVSARYRDRDGKLHTVTNADPHAEAFALYQNADYAGAIREYTKAIEANPRDAEAYYWRGLAHKNLDQWDSAAADLKTAIDLAPAQLPGYENLDSVLSQRQEWDVLIATWTRLIQLQPNNAQAYYYRAGNYLRKGDRASAIRDAEKSCELGSGDGCRTAQQLRSK